MNKDVICGSVLNFLSDMRLGGVKSKKSIILACVIGSIGGGASAAVLDGYTKCNEVQVFDTVVDVAYGAGGRYSCLDNVSGLVCFNSTIFGDPAPDALKVGYYRAAQGGDVGKAYTWNNGAEPADFKDVSQSVNWGVLSMTLRSWKKDPYVRLKQANVDASKYTHVRLKVRNKTNGTAWRLYFKPVGKGEGGNAISFTVPRSNSWKTYVVKMNTDRDWNGTISSIRLDPQGRVSGTVDVDSVEIISEPGGDITPPGGSVKGVLPQGMPKTFSVGLFSGHGDNWMSASNVPWDLRYRYLVKGWIDNWGWTPEPGLWALNYFKECDAQGYTPCVQYYQLFNEGGNNEANTYKTIKNGSVMRSYFSDFKVLMERVKEYNKPVLVMLEADAFGLLSIQTGFNPNAYASIASSGMPELSGLPDTVSGWGLAFLKIRESVGAKNAILGMHISAWGTGKDISYGSITDPLQPEVDKAYNFLRKLGLEQNVTGGTYDLLVGDPCDRDADYYRLKFGDDRWWDMSDNAPISSKSYNRYAEWLRLWNIKAKKRWVLWQIPLGNSSHKNVANTGSMRGGYKDNRVEYFMSNGNQSHAKKFAEAGVIALLFGAGKDDQSSYQNDYDQNGALYMKSQGQAFYANGVFRLQP